MKEIGNPFQEETADLLTQDTKTIAAPGAGEMVTICKKDVIPSVEAFAAIYKYLV